MSLSRRGFFKGAAATGATIATGGGSAVAGVAAKAVAVGAGVVSAAETLGVSEKYLRVFQVLLKKNTAYPENILAQIGDRFKDAASLPDRLLERAPWPRHKERDGYYNTGKIDIQDERSLLWRLQGLPEDLPVLDALSESVIEDLQNAGRGKALRAEGIRATRVFLEPLCTPETTAGDLTRILERHFIKLARHAALRPDDFGMAEACDRSGRLTEAYLEGRSDLSELSRILKGFGKKNPDAASLADTLGDVAKRHEARIIPQIMGKSNEKWDINDRAFKRIQEEQRKKSESDLSIRQKHFVEMAALGGGRYLVHLRGSQSSAPTRMDWLHFVQEIDPAHADASGLELDEEDRLMITFRNKAVVDFIESEAKSRPAGNQGKRFRFVQLPNRRMGVDLNSCAPDIEI